MSLGGVALAVGMLVDNSIVVLEAVHRYKASGIACARRQCTRERRKLRLAMVASTFTSIAVFLPLIFVVGIAGQLFRDQALTITYGQLRVAGRRLHADSDDSGDRSSKGIPRGIDGGDAVVERPLSDKPWFDVSQIISRWIEAKWRVFAQALLFRDIAAVILTDLRRMVQRHRSSFVWDWSTRVSMPSKLLHPLSKMYQPAVEAALNNKYSSS